MSSKQTVSREEYRRLDNRVTCILLQRWPADEISQWVGMLKGKQQAIACAILRRRHPRPEQLALPAIAAEVPNPYQAKASRPTVPVLTADGRQAGRRHIVEGLTPVVIDQNGTIRCATTGRTLWIAPGSPTDRANSGAAELLNPNYRPAVHQVVAGHCQIWKPPPNHLK
ncbi:hypothetical protein H9X88_13020 [Aeromonas hydrophila]|uniref:hypothetical protein n=1 Tax=Aeromonas hydrophila TaxID=644 RepID=UPI001B3A6C7E|nr:hypothetical protein [Aeromonas hydrophila]MBQ4677176.1 hypothetical protein [Aeromonas hydrophila]MBW3813780.1 hypothetical protein [Aeromonas hydrophila]MCF7679009.1 hypothetical protein [Aeromonas hydrophila]MCF7692057.1 hypothetical protein [Aeromonas hydrophila]MCF7772857.1 hypothetical protein [Aeromonas hydrophila]